MVMKYPFVTAFLKDSGMLKDTYGLQKVCSVECLCFFAFLKRLCCRIM